jgi:hypothetical protein
LWWPESPTTDRHWAWFSFRDGHRNYRLAGEPRGHPLSRRLSSARANPRLLVQQSRAAAPAATPSWCSSDGFHLCCVVGSHVLAKASSLAVDTRSCRRLNCLDYSWRNERDLVDSSLAADDASVRCLAALDPACTCLSQLVVCQATFQRSRASKRDQRGQLGSRFQRSDTYQACGSRKFLKVCKNEFDGNIKHEGSMRQWLHIVSDLSNISLTASQSRSSGRVRANLSDG